MIIPIGWIKSCLFGDCSRWLTDGPQVTDESLSYFVPLVSRSSKLRIKITRTYALSFYIAISPPFLFALDNIDLVLFLTLPWNLLFWFSFFIVVERGCRMCVGVGVGNGGGLDFLAFTFYDKAVIIFKSGVVVLDVVLVDCVRLVHLRWVIVKITVVIHGFSINIRKLTHIILLRLITHRVPIQIPIHAHVYAPVLVLETLLVRLRLVCGVLEVFGHGGLGYHCALGLFAESHKLDWSCFDFYLELFYGFYEESAFAYVLFEDFLLFLLF